MNDLESLANWIINNQDKKGTEAYDAAVSALKELDAKNRQESQTTKVSDVERQRLEQRLEDAKYAQSQGEDVQEEIKTVEAALGRAPEQSQPTEPQVVSQEPTQDQLERAKFQLAGGLSGTAAAIGSAGRGGLSAIGRAFGEGFQQGLGGSAQNPAATGTPGQKWWQKVVNDTGPTPNVGSSTEAANKYNALKNQGKISGKADKIYGPRLPGEPADLVDRPAWRAQQSALAEAAARPSPLQAITQRFNQIAETPLGRGALNFARRAAMPLAGYEVFGDVYDVAKALQSGKRQEAILPSLKAAATLGSFPAPMVGLPALAAISAYENNVPRMILNSEVMRRQDALSDPFASGLGYTR